VRGSVPNELDPRPGREAERVTRARAGEEPRASNEQTETPPANATAAPTDLSATTDPTDAGAPANTNAEGPASPRAPPKGSGYVRPRHHPWADLLRRAFEIDVLACPDCGGRLRLVATIEQRALIEKILSHLDLPTELPSPAPVRSADWLPGCSH
jgi:hypothetical protein